MGDELDHDVHQVRTLAAMDIAARAAGCGNVGVAHVVHDHPVGAEAPAERADGTLDPQDPLARKPVPIPVVIEAGSLRRQHAQQ